MKENRIVIVGAGFVGATLAWYLSNHYLSSGDKGKIILIDKGLLGNGVTKQSFAWLNVSYGRPGADRKLRQQALNEWHKLDKQTNGKLNVNWSGAISWQETEYATRQFIDDHNKSGFKITALTKDELLTLEPQLSSYPDIAAFATEEGAVDPIHATQFLLQEAINNGVTYLPETEVTSINHNGKQITGVTTSQKAIHAEQIVLTAGVGTISLMETLGETAYLSSSPSIIVQYQHQANIPFVRHIISSPDLEVRPVSGTRLLAAEDYISDQPEHSAMCIAQKALTLIKESFIGSDSLCLEQASVGIRPMPDDGMPIVGKVADYQGLYMISMHTAITLAPLMCRLAQEEITNGTEQAELKPFRIARFVPENK
ncbi:FAD-binding oxidoreductase [Xenorhabdus sp. PB30.3]|uniref:NAD(P)/FAD-dependent oxidoreductase n=1 Tax=Xenorhabdus sp. PB30.3 TaxID=2788941 RepID=UPI001E3A8151|nr:FAD-binding oxidoreductase [Xenorhabdus sp. PB30.3]MCC8379641.1 FAD-binding oxidoreductase [Xenorhabdus sp. PB30.3]